MGRGDKKSKKGKRTKGSFGVSRNRNSIKGKLKRSAQKAASAPAEPAAEAPAKPKRTVKKKAE
jgi:ribosomal small subunit protein bTHX